MQNLRNADQESKTLSGTIKVVKAFWKSGYKEAFAGLVSAADIMGVNAPAILAKCLKDDKGQACTHSRRAEKNPDGSPFTAHTTNVVPFAVIGAGDVKLREGGCLADIAPTMLPYIGLPVPSEMTGKSLIVD